jgi:hypothetical protein
LPFDDDYWYTPRSDASIAGRGMTMVTSQLHMDRENPFTNEHTAPFVFLAAEIFYRAHVQFTPMSAAELEQRLWAIAKAYKIYKPLAHRTRKVRIQKETAS